MITTAVSAEAVVLAPSAVAERMGSALIEVLVSKSGKEVGKRVRFSEMSASELRKSLKESGFKGRELTDKINETLNGGADSRRIVGIARMQDLINKGFLPDTSTERSKSADIKFVKPVEPKVKASTVIKDATRLGRADQEKLLAELKKALHLDEAAIDIAADAATEGESEVTEKA